MKASISLVITAVILSAILIAGVIVANGWALATLWGWFIVPTFGLPSLSIPVAIGICLIVGFLTHQPVQSSKPKQGRAILAGRLFEPFVVVALGWVVKSLI